MYNVEKYLRRCLDSVQNQTFTDWQAICVDDGSPDKSGEIAEEYAKKDKRFVVIHKENGGQSEARNIAVQYWTINDPDEMRELIELGCDCIMTDDPELLSQVLEEYK